MDEFSLRLKQLREEKGLTQAELAKVLSDEEQVVSPQLVSYWEKGRQPSFIYLNRIADIFNVSMDYLIGRTEFKNVTEELEYKQANETGMLDFLNEKDKKEFSEILNMLLKDIAELYAIDQSFINSIMSNMLNLGFIISSFLEHYLLTPELSKDNIIEFLNSKGYTKEINIANIYDAISGDLLNDLEKKKEYLAANTDTFILMLKTHFLQTKCPNFFELFYLDKFDNK